MKKTITKFQITGSEVETVYWVIKYLGMDKDRNRKFVEFLRKEITKNEPALSSESVEDIIKIAVKELNDLTNRIEPYLLKLISQDKKCH